MEMQKALELAIRIHELQSFSDYEAADYEESAIDTAQTIINAPEVVIEYLLDIIEDLEAERS